MKRRSWIIVGVVVAAIAAFFVWRALNPAPTLPPYKTAVLATGDLTEQITANGVLNPVRVVNVGTQVSGTVEKLYVDFNDRVVKGQVLLRLDPSVYAARVAASEAQLAQVRANAALAAANARRSEQLFKQDYIARQDYETSLASQRATAAQVSAAQAQVRQDRSNLGYSIIRSPVSGVIISRQIDIGQTVAASFNTPTLFQIAQDLTQMQIEATVAEADIAKVRPGQRVDFTVDAYGARRFAGTVNQLRLNPTTLQNVVTYTVIVSVANPDGALLPGMTANASFVVSEKRDVLLIPNAALSFKPEGWKPGRRNQAASAGGASGERAGRGGRGGRQRNPDAVTVFVLAGDEPQPRRITIGAADADFSEVTSGPVKAGDTIITGANTAAKKPGGIFSGPPGANTRQRGTSGRGGAPAV